MSADAFGGEEAAGSGAADTEPDGAAADAARGAEVGAHATWTIARVEAASSAERMGRG
jgi:hypothetical protein